jgi:hypothetical protein
MWSEKVRHLVRAANLTYAFKCGEFSLTNFRWATSGFGACGTKKPKMSGPILLRRKRGERGGEKFFPAKFPIENGVRKSAPPGGGDQLNPYFQTWGIQSD